MTTNIGIVAAWDLRGGGHCGRFLAQALMDHYPVHVYAHYLYSRGESIPLTSLTHYPANEFDLDHFTRWLQDRQIKIIFFHEKLQYHDDKNASEILRYCKQNGIVTVLILMQEIIYPQHIAHYQTFSWIFCPVQCTYDILETYGISNKFFLRWGIDESKFTPHHQSKSSPITILFNSGLGGGRTWRKNPAAVVKAFHRASKLRPELHLIFKSQRPLKDYSKTVRTLIKKNRNITLITQHYSEKKMHQLYARTDVSLLPSKWEGIGIPFLEALAAGHPIITVDCAPMNEWVRHEQNGLCARPAKWLEPYKVLVDSRDLARQMIRVAAEPELINQMGIRSREMIQDSFNNFSKGLRTLINQIRGENR